MITRRTALVSGRTLNEAAERFAQMAQAGLMAPEQARAMREAVRVANAVMFQYYLIPRDVREAYHRDELESREE